MHLRNGHHGYGVVSKILHWVTVAVLVTQFVVGWTMDPDGAADQAADRAEERLDALEEAAEAQGEAAEQRFEAEAERLEEAADARAEAAESSDADIVLDVLSGDALSDGFQGLELHVLLGLGVVLLAIARLVWRRVGALPPWAEHLGTGERRLEAWLEKAMLTLMFVVPGTGLLLLLWDYDLLPLHIAAQLALIAVVAVHVGLVLRHTVVERHRELQRML